MPGIPDRNLRGELIAESSALIFKAANGSLILTVPWNQIKGCRAYSKLVNTARANTASMFGINHKDWFISLTWNSVQYHMEMTASFYLGTARGGNRYEHHASELAKTILTIRAQALDKQ